MEESDSVRRELLTADRPVMICIGAFEPMAQTVRTSERLTRWAEE